MFTFIVTYILSIKSGWVKHFFSLLIWFNVGFDTAPIVTLQHYIYIYCDLLPWYCVNQVVDGEYRVIYMYITKSNKANGQHVLFQTFMNHYVHAIMIQLLMQGRRRIILTIHTFLMNNNGIFSVLASQYQHITRILLPGWCIIVVPGHKELCL